MVANLAAVVNVTSNMVQPAVLKFAPTRWQLIIQLIYGGVYLVVGYTSASWFGVWGFCVSSVIAAVFRLLILLGIGGKYVQN